MGGFWQQGIYLFHWKEALLWIMDILARSKTFKILHKQLFTSQEVNWCTGVVWIIVMFLSSVWTLILTAPIHCRASTDKQVMQCNFYPNLFRWRNKRISILDDLRVWTFSTNFHFWVNYFFKSQGVNTLETWDALCITITRVRVKIRL